MTVNKLYLLPLALLLFVAVSACKSEPEKAVKPAKENLIEIKDGIFTEYYPGRKHIKFQGPQDDQGQRDGRWVFYAENGTELSVTLYSHGKKHGHTVVKYPDGRLYYFGEYNMDVKIGVWKTYGPNGDLIEEKDFGTAP